MNTTVTIPITGMHCGSCHRRVQAALQNTTGVSRVAVNVLHKNATVTFDASVVAPQQLVEAIRAAGYEASLSAPTTPAAAADVDNAKMDEAAISDETAITVKGGYAPRVVRLKRGVPTRLVFDRQEASRCSEEIVIPALGVRQFLPPFKQTVVEVMPKDAGTFEMTCGMSMLRGTLLVEG